MSANRKRARRKRRRAKAKAKKRAHEALLRRGEKHFEIARRNALRSAAKTLNWSWKPASKADRYVRLIDYTKDDATITQTFYRHHVAKSRPQPVPGKVELGTICLKRSENESTAESVERP